MSFGDIIIEAVLGKVSVPEDTNNAPNVITEGAAVNTTVGITAHSTFANGNASLDYSLSADNSGGGFKIDHNTGVVTVADPSKIDFETAPIIPGIGHAYTITVLATKNNNFSNEQTFIITVNDVAPSTPVDSNAAANTVLEGAANGTAVGITASSTDVNGPGVTWSLTGDSSGGGFTINTTTGVITVADGTKIDYESSAGHAYTVTATASDGTLPSSQTFTINVGDVAMTTPVDANAAGNSVSEGAAAGTTVGITASATDPSGPAATYSLIGDTSGGGFTINASTGVVSVANPAKIDFESTAPGHTYNITVQASNGVQTTSQVFTIGVTDVAPSAPTDGNSAANTALEGAANGTVVGVTASSSDINGGAVTYSLTGDSSGGGFAINATTGVITVADGSKINYETAAGHAYTVTATASDGTLTNSQTFTIAVGDVAPSAPMDNDGAINTVAEGAANGSAVGVTAFSTDVNGPAVTYSLVDDTSGGGFAINATTGVVTVANGTRLDYETTPSHAYTITAQASDGTLTNSQTFTIALTDVAPSAPSDINFATNTVAEGAANGSTVGITASSVDPNGPPASYSLTATAGGRFAIDSATGVVTVANGAAIDFESSAGAGHTYSIIVQGTAGAQSTTQSFSIGVTNVAPSTPTDSNVAADSVVEGQADGTAVGITAASTDPGGGPAMIWSLMSDSSGGGFAIDPNTGVLSVANHAKIDYETAAGHAYSVTVQASDGTATSSKTFSIAVTDVAPGTPTDGNSAAETVVEGATTGALVGITASSTDVNGPAVSYSFADIGGGVLGNAGGRFQISSSTGVVSVSAFGAANIDYESASGHAYSVSVQASDGTLTSAAQTFTIAVTNAAPSAPGDADASNANTVTEGMASDVYTGLTAASTDPNSAASTVTYSFAPGGDAGGRFAINSTTGAVSTGSNANLIDFESSGGSYSVTVRATDSSGAVNNHTDQTFAIAVANANPSTPTGAAASILEGSATGASTGLTVQATDPGGGPALSYTLTDDAGGRFQIFDPTTGVVTAGPHADRIDFETSGGSYNITAQASDGAGGISTKTFTIAVTDAAPADWSDADGGTNTISEDAADGAAVGISAHATDVNGGTVKYSFASAADSANGRFQIGPDSGVVTVSSAVGHTPIDFELSGGTYHIVVTAATVNGTATSTQGFDIGVADVAPSNLMDNDGAAGGSVAEGTVGGATPTVANKVGITAHADDVHGGDVIYTLTNDAGLFDIDHITGEVFVKSGAVLDYESTGPGHSFSITVSASDGTLASTENFSIAITNVAPSAPGDTNNADNLVNISTAHNGDAVGITLSSTEVNSGAITYSLVDDAGGLFEITPANASTGIVTVKNVAGLTAGQSYHLVAHASDGTDFSSDSVPGFDINVIDNQLRLDLDSGAGGFGNTASFTEDGSATPIANAASIFNAGANPGNPNVGNATAASAVLANAQTGDVLKVNGSSGPSGSVVLGGETINWTTTSGGGQITVNLTGTATYDHYEQALQLITFSNGTDTPNTSNPRTINVTVTDATGTSSPAASIITVQSVNDAPTLNLTLTATPGYLENASPTALVNSGTVTDPDNPANFSGGTYKIDVTDASAGDQIVVTGAGFSVNGTSLLFGGTAIGTLSSVVPFNSTGDYTLTVTLNGNATSSVVNQLVSAFSYRNVSDDPTGGTRHIDLTFNDGGKDGTAPSSVAKDSNTVHQTVDVTPVNDAPVAQNGTETTNENASLSTTVPAATDVDGSIDHYVLDTDVGAGNGSLTFNANGSYSFNPGTDFDSLAATGARNVSFTYHAVDNGVPGLPSPTATVTIAVTGLNDAPVVTAATLAAVNEDTAVSPGQTVAALFSGHFTDVDAGSSLKGIAISANAATAGEGSWEYSTDGGASWFAVGAPDPADALLLDAGARLRFVPAANFNGTPGSLSAFGLDDTFDSGTNPFSSGATTHTFDVGTTHGGTSAVSNVSAAISTSITAVNDAPVINHLGGDLAMFTEGGLAVLLDSGTAATVTDVDSANFDTGSLTVSITANRVDAEDVLGIDTSVGTTVTLSSATSAGSVVSVDGTAIGTIAAGGTGSSGDDLIIDFNANATPAAVQTLVRALTYDDTNATTASALTRGITVTLVDGDGGTSTTTVSTSVAVNEPVSQVTSQLYYVTRESPTAGDNVVGHFNSDGSGVTHFSVAAETKNDIAVDTSANLYFVLDSTNSLAVHNVSTDAAVGSSFPAAGPGEITDAIALDPFYHSLFVTVQCSEPDQSGIKILDYNPATGVVGDPGTYLINVNTVPGFNQAVDLWVDASNQLLYYVDSNPLAATYTGFGPGGADLVVPASNAIYVVSYANGANVATNTTATPLVQLATDGSEGFIEAVTVDNRGTASTADDRIYFLTDDTTKATPGTASLWFLDQTGSNTTPALVAIIPALAGVSSHTGLSFDSASQQLYISNQDASGNTDAILQLQLNLAGDTVTGSTTHDLAFLTGQPTPDNATIPGQTAIDELPTITLTAPATAAFAETDPSTAVVLDSTLAVSDPDLYLRGATITTAGGFAGDGDTLTFDTAFAASKGISLTTNTAGGNVALTFSGRALASDYQHLLQSVAFDSGDNPTNFGDTNVSRTVTWHVDDGAAGDPHSAGNTKTSTINLTATNDAPVAQDGTASGNEDTPITGQALATDPDNTAAQLTYNVVSPVDPAKGVLVFDTANGSFTYLPNADFFGSDQFTFNVTDGTATSLTKTVTITVDPVNDAPVVATSGGAAHADEQIAAQVDTGLTVSDVDNTTLNHATVSVTGNFHSGEDVLAFVNNDSAAFGNIHFDSYTGGVLSLSSAGSTATTQQWQAALRAVTFTDSSDTPDTADRTISFVVNDGSLDSTVATKTVNVFAVNDTPAIDLHNFMTSYTLGTTGKPIAGTVDITDPDSANITKATITIEVPVTGDLLSVSGALPAGIIASSYDPGMGQLTLTGSASKAAYDQAVAQVVFSSTSSDTTTRLVDVTVDDGQAANHQSNTATSTIAITSNAAPVANDDVLHGFERGGANNAGAPAHPDPSGNVLTGVTTTGQGGETADTDTDGPAPITVVAVRTENEAAAGGNSGTVGNPLAGTYGSLTLNSDGSYSYTVDNSNAAVQALRTSADTVVDSFTYTIQDGLSASDTSGTGATNSKATLSITIEGANDAPTAVADTANVTEAGGVNNATPGGNATPTGNALDNDTDPDTHGETKTVQGIESGNHPGDTVTSVLSNPVAGQHGSILMGANGAYTYSVTETDAAVQALRTSAQTITDTFTYTMHDLAGATSTSTITVTIHGQDDDPVAANDTASATEAGGAIAGTNPSGNVITGAGGVDSDADSAANGELISVQGVEFGDNPAHVVSGGVATGIGGAYGTLTLNSNGSFGYVVNQATANALNTTDHPTDIFTYTIRDTDGHTSTAKLTVTVNGTNDAPVAANDGTPTPYVVAENRSTSVITPTLLANDTDVDTAAGNLTAVKNTDTVHGGTVTVNTGGTFSVAYAAGSNYLGSDSFTYHINDNGTPNLSSNAATVTLDVQPLVWYIDDSVGAVSDGTHFTSVASFVAANNAASATTRPDIIYIRAGDDGNYSSNVAITLKDGQVLLGQGVDLAYTKTLGGTGTLEFAGQTPTIHLTAATDGVTLAQNNTLRGFNIDTGTQTGAIGIEDGGGSVGTLTTSQIGITGQGKAIDIDQGGTLSASFTNITSGSNASSTSGSASEGIQLGGVAGSLLGGTFAVTGTTSVTNATGNAIQVLNTAAGASFNFGNTTVSDTVSGGHTGNGVNLLTGIGATNSFTFSNLADTTDGGFGLAANGGTINIGGTGSTINATGGAAIDLTNTSLGSGATFATVSSTNSTGAGIQITGLSTGAFTANGGAISNPTGTDVSISGGTSNITYDGTITDDLGQLVSVANKTGGTVAFGGAITDLNNGSGNGISLTNDTGATINFTGGTTLSTGANAAFTATGGGTVNVTGTNHLTTTSGTALNVANTTIGGSGLTFRDISSNGAASGIVLNNTGSTAGLTVTGDGGASNNHSGGTINASTGPGVSLTSTKGVSLNYLDITNGTDDGIHGESVNGFTLNRANVTNNGNSTADDGIQFGLESGATVGLTGAVSITNSSVSGNAHNNVHIRDTSGTISSLTVTGSSFNNLNDTFGANSFLFEGSGTSVLTSATFSGNTVQNNSPQRGLEVQAHDTANVGTFTVSGNTFIDNGIQASFTQDGSANLTFKFLNNGTAGTPMTGSILQAVNVFSSSQATGGTIVGTIAGNFIGNAAVANSGSTQGGGISATLQGQTDATLLIDGNNIKQTFGDSRGIYVGVRGPANPLAGTLGPNTVVSDVTITNNVVTPGNTANNFGAAIVVEADNQTGADNKAPTIRADIRGNTVPTVATRPVNGEFFNAHIIYFEYSSAGSHGIGQLVDTAPASADGTAQLTSTNTGTSQASAGIALIAGPIGTPPLNAAPGGVQALTPTPGETHLTQAQLDSVVAAAIANWAAAGASAAQLAMLAALTFTVADLAGTRVGEQTPGHILIDPSAAGHGWFVDTTPNDNSEFTHAANAAGTDLDTDPGNAAAGHLDLLTAVSHEMGHALGLDDKASPTDAHDLMYLNLVDGERRLPDATDIAEANGSAAAQAAEAALPLSAQAAAGTPIVIGTAGNDTIDAGHGDAILFGGAGADSFVFGPGIQLNAPTPAQITHVADYSAAQGDTFDFSALTSAFHNSSVNDSLVVRAVEDASGKFAMLQVDHIDPMGLPSAPNWVDVAQLDGVHAGDAVNILIHNHSVHLAQIHVDLLV
jgi:VCBS repeat-containing protein